MNEAVLSPIIAALAALFGAALNSHLQTRSQSRLHQMQQDSDAERFRREQGEKARQEALQRLTLAHKLLSKTAREFSLTNLDIMWREELSEGKYDLRYLAACGEMDELRALIGLHEPDLSEEIESIYGQMNLFWGNFKTVLYQTAKGEKVDHHSDSLMKAHLAANEIGKKTAFVKSRLTDRMRETRSA